MQRSIDEYILSLGNINHERLYAIARHGTLYVHTDLPPYALGYTIPNKERYLQRTIEDYLNPAERPTRDAE